MSIEWVFIAAHTFMIAGYVAQWQPPDVRFSQVICFVEAVFATTIGTRRKVSKL
jgi:hypothetical protein